MRLRHRSDTTGGLTPRDASDHGQWQRSPRLELERRPAADFRDRDLRQLRCGSVTLGELSDPVGARTRDPDFDVRVDCGRDRLQRLDRLRRAQRDPRGVVVGRRLVDLQLSARLGIDVAHRIEQRVQLENL